MKKLFLMGAVMCFMAGNVFGGIVELNDADLASFVNTGWDAGNSHVTTDIAGDPGVQWDITYSAHTGWAGYDVHTNYTAVGGIGSGDTWEITLKNLSPYYVWLDPYLRTGDAWVYEHAIASYLGPAGSATEIVTFSVTASDVVKDMIIQTDVPGPGAGWDNNLPHAGDVISLQIIPEPATIALLGLGGLILRRRRNA